MKACLDLRKMGVKHLSTSSIGDPLRIFSAGKVKIIN